MINLFLLFSWTSSLVLNVEYFEMNPEAGSHVKAIQIFEESDGYFAGVSNEFLLTDDFISYFGFWMHTEGGLDQPMIITDLPYFIPADGLVGWWSFSGNTTDQSGNGNNASPIGAVLTEDRFGLDSGAYYFDGINDYINIESTVGLNSTGGISMALWFKWGGPTGSSGEKFIYQIAPNPNGALVISEEGILRAAVTNCNCADDKSLSIKVDQDRWYHAVLTYDLATGTMKLYLNGILQGISTENLFSYYTTNNSGDRFGAYHFDLYYFKGWIDDAALWNRELTQSEVLALYSGSNEYPVISLTLPAGNQFTYGDKPTPYQAIISSGQKVTVASSDESVIQVNGDSLNVKGAGTATVTATVPGTSLIAEQLITVNKAPLLVTAESKSRKFVEANPAFTLTYSGFKNNETSAVIDAAPTASTTATPTSNTGTYPITVSGGTDNNYTFSYTAGTLTITKATQSIAFASFADVAQTVGTFSLSATAASGLPVTFTSSDPSRVSITGSTAMVVSPGPVTITASQAGNENYEAAASVSRTFCVLPPAPVVTITGGAVLTLNSSATNGNQWFKNGQAVSGANGTTLEVSASAIFTVKTTIEGCASPLSEAVNLIITSDTDQLSEADSPVELFPNPVSTELKYQLSESWWKGSSVRLINASGRALISHDGQMEGIIDVSALPTGVYLFQVRKGRESVVLKVIKQ